MSDDLLCYDHLESACAAVQSAFKAVDAIALLQSGCEERTDEEFSRKLMGIAVKSVVDSFERLSHYFANPGVEQQLRRVNVSVGAIQFEGSSGTSYTHVSLRLIEKRFHSLLPFTNMPDIYMPRVTEPGHVVIELDNDIDLAIVEGNRSEIIEAMASLALVDTTRLRDELELEGDRLEDGELGGQHGRQTEAEKQGNGNTPPAADTEDDNNKIRAKGGRKSKWNHVVEHTEIIRQESPGIEIKQALSKYHQKFSSRECPTTGQYANAVTYRRSKERKQNHDLIP